MDEGLGLDLDNILSPEQIDNMFGTENKQEPAKTEQTAPVSDNKETTEVNADELFETQQPEGTKPESVGSGDNNQAKGEPQTQKEPDGTSPKPNFYSSTASALKDDGVLPDLDDSEIEKIQTPEDLSEAINKHIEAQLDEKQRRIDTALKGGVEPSAVKQFEDTIGILNSISDDAIGDESDKGENLRKQLIYNDAINRGFSKERAMREVETSFEKGNDIDDAKEALESSKAYYGDKYRQLLDYAKAQDEERRRGIIEQANQFKKELLEDKEVFKDIQLDNTIRKKAFESMTKPVFKDEDGNYLTPIQKYEHDNPIEFRKKLGVIYALTDGFENLTKLVDGPVKKEIKSKMRELEHTFNTTRTNSDGSLKFESGVSDSESVFKGWKVDI